MPEIEMKAGEDGSLTLDNASVQRLMDYGLLHYTDEGWHVGKWPQTNTPSRPTPDLGEDDLERRTRAVENVSSFANFANGRLPPHVSDDLKIVVELARAALSQVR